MSQKKCPRCGGKPRGIRVPGAGWTTCPACEGRLVVDADPGAPLICSVCWRQAGPTDWPTHPAYGGRYCPICEQAGVGIYTPVPMSPQPDF
jgi:hypothetical protein